MMPKLSSKSITSLTGSAKSKSGPSDMMTIFFKRMMSGFGALVFLMLVLAHIYYSNQMTQTPDIHVEKLDNNLYNTFVDSKPKKQNGPTRIPKATIAFATTITKCTNDSIQLDQAAVLMYSIHKTSFRVPESGSQYDYDLIVFLHSEAGDCKKELERIGWTVLIKNTPVEVDDIRGSLKEYVRTASCCGEKEFLKLYSYTLTDYPIVVHFDLDVIVLQPMDELYDSMIDGPSSSARGRVAAMWQSAADFPHDIEGFFTRDYNMIGKVGRRQPHQIGVQGGFIIVKPNLEYYEEYRQIILKGNFTPRGWGDRLGYGGYYGAAQVQGLCSYYFGHVRPNTTVELNRCLYNSIVDSPFQQEPDSDVLCRTLQPLNECEDCRETSFYQIKTAHLTVCQKPWKCSACKGHTREAKKSSGLGRNAYTLCMQMHHAWFKLRRELELIWSSRDEDYKIMLAKETETHMLQNPVLITATTLGYCAARDKEHYFPMKFPPKKIDFKAF